MNSPALTILLLFILKVVILKLKSPLNLSLTIWNIYMKVQNDDGLSSLLTLKYNKNEQKHKQLFKENGQFLHYFFKKSTFIL